MVSILPGVDLLKNTEVNSFCILSLLGLDTLSNVIRPFHARGSVGNQIRVIVQKRGHA